MHPFAISRRHRQRRLANPNVGSERRAAVSRRPLDDAAPSSTTLLRAADRSGFWLSRIGSDQHVSKPGEVRADVGGFPVRRRGYVSPGAPLNVVGCVVWSRCRDSRDGGRDVTNVRDAKQQVTAKLNYVRENKRLRVTAVVFCTILTTSLVMVAVLG